MGLSNPNGALTHVIPERRGVREVNLPEVDALPVHGRARSHWMTLCDAPARCLRPVLVMPWA